MTNTQKDAWLSSHPDHEALSDEQEEAWFKAHPWWEKDDHASGIVVLGGVEYTADGEPVAKTRSTSRPPRKIRSGAKKPRLPWPYAPTPRSIAKDRRLSLNAKAVALMIADALNLRPGNRDLHVDLSYPELAARGGVSRSTVMRSVDALKKAGYLTVESRTRGGCRFRFVVPPVTLTSVTGEHD